MALPKVRILKFNTVEPQTRALGGNLRIVVENGNLHDASFPVCVPHLYMPVRRQEITVRQHAVSHFRHAILASFGHPRFVPDTYALPQYIHLWLSYYCFTLLNTHVICEII